MYDRNAVYGDYDLCWRCNTIISRGTDMCARCKKEVKKDVKKIKRKRFWDRIFGRTKKED